MEPPLVDISPVLDQESGSVDFVLEGAVVQWGHPAAEAAGVTADRGRIQSNVFVVMDLIYLNFMPLGPYEIYLLFKILLIL